MSKPHPAMSGPSEGLIDAVAAALARALAAHGVSPADGNPTVQAECAQLCAEWGGRKAWLPTQYRRATQARIEAELAAGHSVTEAAKAAGVHPRTVQRIANRPSLGFGRDEWVL